MKLNFVNVLRLLVFCVIGFPSNLFGGEAIIQVIDIANDDYTQKQKDVLEIRNIGSEVLLVSSVTFTSACTRNYLDTLLSRKIKDTIRIQPNSKFTLQIPKFICSNKDTIIFSSNAKMGDSICIYYNESCSYFTLNFDFGIRKWTDKPIRYMASVIAAGNIEPHKLISIKSAMWFNTCLYTGGFSYGDSNLIGTVTSGGIDLPVTFYPYQPNSQLAGVKYSGIEIDWDNASTSYLTFRGKILAPKVTDTLIIDFGRVQQNGGKPILKEFGITNYDLTTNPSWPYAYEARIDSLSTLDTNLSIGGKCDSTHPYFLDVVKGEFPYIIYPGKTQMVKLWFMPTKVGRYSATARCSTTNGQQVLMIFKAQTIKAIPNDVEEANIYGITLQPNPAKDMLEFSIPNSINNNSYQISITDIAGNTVYSSPAYNAGDLITGQIETKALPSGEYFFLLQLGSEKLTQKFVIVH